MEISGTYTLNAARERVWSHLLDPAVLRRCIPGCEALEPRGEDDYRLRLNVGIAAFKGLYDGNLRITERAAPERYHLAVEGSGARGVLTGEGTVILEARAPTTTFVTYTGQAQLGGAVAGVGNRVVGAAARVLINQFFARLADELAKADATTTAGVTPDPETEPAPATIAAHDQGAGGSSALEWSPGLPEARPLESEQAPAIAQPLAAMPATPSATPSATTRAQLPASGTARMPAPAPLTRFVRRAGLTDGSVESERRLAQGILATAAGLTLGLVAATLASLVARLRRR